MHRKSAEQHLRCEATLARVCLQLQLLRTETQHRHARNTWHITDPRGLFIFERQGRVLDLEGHIKLEAYDVRLASGAAIFLQNAEPTSLQEPEEIEALSRAMRPRRNMLEGSSQQRPEPACARHYCVLMGFRRRRSGRHKSLDECRSCGHVPFRDGQG
jgi:hypothetical protein